jgi:4-amino-4-deoxy-L-arabinose transferase-like glycosyltransferase
VLLLVWGSAWTLFLLWAVREVPVDSAEQMAWVRSLQWGYHKHPPLPTWLIAPGVAVFGLQAWIPAVWGALVKLLALLLCWDLMRRLFDVKRATLALVCITAVVYYSSRLHTYSHNEVMLLCSSSAAWALWQLLQTAQRRYGLMLGLSLGLGLLAKYQAVTTIAAALAVLLITGAWRQPRFRPALVLALVAAVGVVLPHALWLAGAAHTPLDYAAQSTGASEVGEAGRWAVWLVWNGDLLGRSLGALLLLAGVAWWARGQLPMSQVPTPTASTNPSSTTLAACFADPRAHARVLLWCWALVPLAFVWALALLGGGMVRPHWATPMALWLVAALCAALPSAAVNALSRPAFWAVAVMVQVALAGQLLWSEQRAAAGEARWGQPRVLRWAPALAEAARAELGGDIRVVVAPETVASTVALALAERPYPVLDGRLDISPWVPEGLIERCGVLFIVYEPSGPGRRPVVGGPPGLVWRVVPPREGRACTGDQKQPAPP